MQKYRLHTFNNHRIAKGLILAALLIIVGLLNPGKAKAVYDGSNLIENALFLNSQTMSIAEIQGFLASKGSGLASRSYVLNCYGPSSLERQWYSAVGAPCDQNIPAADIIYYAAQIYGVNPRVILSTLQKEQSLITSPNPTDWQINQAMGYGCPTTGGCGASNFFYQIDSGTWVLRYHYERANGNNTWWNNGGYTCGTSKNFYKPGLWPGTNVTFYDEAGVAYRTYHIANAATASMYCYTPHAYNNPQGLYGRPPFGTVGQYYTGSYNFVLWYEQWFGSTQFGRAFKASNSDAIYYSIGNYKLSVPHMGVLQDYGISPESVRTLSPEVVSTTPTPPPESGISSSIGSLVKSTSDGDADGGAIYLMSVGKRYQIISMDQFFAFGFQEANIKYLPLTFITSIQSGGNLSNFIHTPNGAVFEVGSSQKRLIFEYQTYIQRNPSDRLSFFSYYLADLIVSGKPISNRTVLFKPKGGSLVYMYTNEAYYPIYTYDAFVCWGFDKQRLPLYTPAENQYVSPITPSTAVDCILKGTTGKTSQLLTADGKRLGIPDAYGLFSSEVYSAPLYTAAEQLIPESGSLKEFVKSSNSAAIWYLTGGARKLIPSYTSFVKLVPDGKFDTISDTVLSKITETGIKLADGTPVKSPGDPAVYAISGNQRILYTSNSFIGYKNTWSGIETHTLSALNQSYPYNGDVFGNYFIDSMSRPFLIDQNGCYLISSQDQTNYSINTSALLAAQEFDINTVPNLNLATCANSSQFVKRPSESGVYRINNGQKQLITNWNTLQTLAGSSNPYIISVSTEFLLTFPSGPNIN